MVLERLAKVKGLRETVFLILSLLVSGCQPRYTNPYNGTVDPERSLQSEGFVSTIYHALSVGGRKTIGYNASTYHLPSDVGCERAQSSNSELLLQIEKDFRLHFGADMVAIERRPHYLLLHILTNIGEEPIARDGTSVLDRVIMQLKQYPAITFQMIGMADRTLSPLQIAIAKRGKKRSASIKVCAT